MTSWPALVSRCWDDTVRCVEAGKLTLDDGHDGALLDGRRALETVGVNTTEELSLQVHVVEGVGGLIVVGLDLACVTGQFVFCVLRSQTSLHSALLLLLASFAHRGGRRSAAQNLFTGTHPQARPQDPCQP
jgi:hypothetical protein